MKQKKLNLGPINTKMIALIDCLIKEKKNDQNLINGGNKRC